MQAPTWSIVTRKIKELKPHPKNPRILSTDDAAHLQASMDKFGLIEKIIINTDGQIIGGHQRYRLLKRKKTTEVECWIPDRQLDEREAEELLIRLNKNHGQWNFDDLANTFEGLDLLEWGFKAEELLGKVEDDEEVSTTTSEPESKEKKKKSSHTCPSCGCVFD